VRWLLAIVALAIAVSTAVADPRTEAMLLFDQGRNEMKAGQYEKACNSFERSIAIYADSGTKGSLARCYEKVGRLASAWLMWRQLADLAPSSDLRKDAAAQAEKLAPRVAHYLLKITAPASGITITINGKPAALTDVPVPIDGGGVIVRAYAPGRKDWSAELTAIDGKDLKIEIPALETLAVTTTGNEDKQPPPPPPRQPSHRKMFGLVIGGVGVGGVVAGAIFGLKAQGKFKDAKDACGGSIDNCNNPAGAQPIVDDARSAGNLSTIFFVAGGAAAVVGIVLVVTAPKLTEGKHVTLAPLAAPNTGGVTLSGRF
jgi:hypothetical protein